MTRTGRLRARVRRVVAVVRPGDAGAKQVPAEAGLRFERTAHHSGAEVEAWAAARPGVS